MYSILGIENKAFVGDIAQQHKCQPAKHKFLSSIPVSKREKEKKEKESRAYILLSTPPLNCTESVSNTL